MRTYPITGQEYTVRQIYEDLKLKDIPHLRFYIFEVSCVLQTSHVTDAELLSIPGVADFKFRYSHTTYEWIPVFCAVDSRKFLEIINVETARDPDDGFWATPKGFPREQ